MPLYNNISSTELPALFASAYEESSNDIDKAAETLDKIDTLLGVMKMKSLINSRDRRAASRWSRGRGLRPILENVILLNQRK